MPSIIWQLVQRCTGGEKLGTFPFQIIQRPKSEYTDDAAELAEINRLEDVTGGMGVIKP